MTPWTSKPRLRSWTGTFGPADLPFTGEAALAEPVRDVGDGSSPASEIEVLVAPRASRNRLVGLHGDRVKIQVTAPPSEGAANRAVIALLARCLDVPARNLELLRGGGARRKTIRVCGLDARQVFGRLQLRPTRSSP